MNWFLTISFILTISSLGKMQEFNKDEVRVVLQDFFNRRSTDDYINFFSHFIEWSGNKKLYTINFEMIQSRCKKTPMDDPTKFECHAKPDVIFRSFFLF